MVKIYAVPAYSCEGVITAPYKGTTSPSGFTNNERVQCGGCGQGYFVRPLDVAKMGGKSQCPHCGKTN